MIHKDKIIIEKQAEKYISVLVSSVIAKAIFLLWFQQKERVYKIKLKPGASKEVEEIGKIFIKQYGKEEIKKVAKVFFKTYNKILD